ncbi:hypothetical protein GCM10027072_46960 [Streptomyces bullii]
MTTIIEGLGTHLTPRGSPPRGHRAASREARWYDLCHGQVRRTWAGMAGVPAHPQAGRTTPSDFVMRTWAVELGRRDIRVLAVTRPRHRPQQDLDGEAGDEARSTRGCPAQTAIR